MIINYNENRASIGSAYIINKQIKDTTLVVFSNKGNTIVKDIIRIIELRKGHKTLGIQNNAPHHE